VINVRDKELIQKFGNNLRRLREQKNLSQEELCYLANLSKNQIGKIERGEVNATISTVFALSKALQLDISELFRFES
jgi:transcriptional regulator with XRE-family HTH domain